ncbi:MAG: DNA mismatch repair protein MutL, partial [Spirochaetia bacterium]|nr:DNA mismatch repair protein MutL [Spirochaetia bacterium]MCF7946777.1 DNA mismatch repair protein MutL [Spirochaetia bacterium]
IIYEELKKRPERQKLLIPLSFTVDPDVDEFLQQHKNIYEQISISLSRINEGTWEMTELPSLCQGLEHELIDFIYNSSGNVQEIEKQLYASISCKAAVKDGDSLDELSAEQLIQKVFLLPEPRCPHGRPIWHIVSREELFRKVQRIV